MNSTHLYHIYKCSPGKFEEYVQKLFAKRIDAAAKKVMELIVDEGFTGTIDNDPHQTGPERGVTYVIPDGTDYYYKLVLIN